MDKNLNIRNSTAEFLIFTSQNAKDSIEVKVQDENVWLTQKLIAELFGKSVSTINEHNKNIYTSQELDEALTLAKFGNSEFMAKPTNYYNLDMIISVGYRVNSKKATQFRQWATRVLSQFAIKGFVLDKKRLKNGSFLGVEYFDELLEQIREIRLSERKFYQKITDIYATSIDYNKDDQLTKEFFTKVQNKLHYGIHGQTASELIVNAYLDLAEERTKRNIPMTMDDWAKRLDIFLEFDDREVLKDSGKVTTQIAKEFALSEFEKYRVIQDKSYRSDFDMLMKEI